MTKRRFTWLDGVICGVLILAIIAGAVWYLKKDNTAVGSDLKDYEVTLRFTKATTQPFDYYQVGDTLYFQNRTAVLGTITGLKNIERRFEEYDSENGRYVAVVDPEQQMVEMTVLVQGAVVDGKFTVNEQNFHIGQIFYPQSDTTRSIMTVWDIEEVQA